MTLGYDTVIYASTELNLTSLERKKVPRTRKQKVGGKIIQHTLPATQMKDYQINGNGVIFDNATVAGTTARALLEDIFAAQTEHNYSDGYVDGNYVIMDLTFNDTNQNPLHFEYKITLLELNEVY